jgi:hypothetical protein
MHDETRIREIASFLHSITPIWHDEILHTYPNYRENYPKSWVDELSSLTMEELFLVDSREDYNCLKNSEFKTFINKIQQLAMIPKEDCKIKKLPCWAFNKVKDKKRHEIGTICSYIGQLKETFAINRVIDIGGGVGHLSRILAYYYGLEATSIDQDKNLQQVGQIRLKKYPRPDQGKSVHFINTDFGQEQNLIKAEINKSFQGNVLTLGLHTCGALSIKHMERSVEQESLMLLNFGCCYNKLDITKDVNLSNIAQSLGIEFSCHALTLATRGHNKMTLKDYHLKSKVKKFRYTLHLLFREKFNLTKFISVGEAHTRVYNGDFSEYALDKLNTLKVEHQLSKTDIMDFFKDPRVENEVRKMFLCNIIRWQLGRVMELYILLDRVLWLKEQNYDAHLKEFFNSNISPRNIGITASRKIISKESEI